MAADKFADEADAYLDRHNVYELFGHLLQQLAIARPAAPIPYLKQLLTQPPAATVRAIIAGPPGAGAATLAATLATQLGVIHIAADTLSESKTGGDIGRVLIDRLTSADCVTKGWIVTGFPNTKAQASTLVSGGVIASHFFLLTLPDQVAKDRALKSEKKILPEALASQFQSYHQHIPSVIDVFAHQLVHIDAQLEAAQVASSVRAELARPRISGAPRRPMRIAVLGPKGAGKDTQCARLAHRHSLVHISVGSLIRLQLAGGAPELASRALPSAATTGALAGAAPGTLLAKIEPALRSGSLISDDIVIPLVIKRLAEADCRRQGWILDGFPRTIGQAKALAAANLSPTRVIVLSVPNDIAIARVTKRRYDPVTGDVYQSANVPGLSAIVTHRLVQREGDSTLAIRPIIDAYSANIDGVTSFYASSPVLLRVDGSGDGTAATDAIQRFVAAPLPQPNAITAK